MAILKIIQEQEFLHKKSKPVTEFNTRLHQLLDDMHDTLQNAGGVGLAAVQVGVLYRVCIVVTPKGPLELINPEIINQGDTKMGEEGCLSIPNIFEMIERPQYVVVQAQNRFGHVFKQKFKGIQSVCACHEIDHMEGILFTERKKK